MSVVDVKRFPYIIIEIPKNQFPDSLSIFIWGKPVLSIKGDNYLNQVTGKALDLAKKTYGGSVEFKELKIYNEKDFKKESPDGTKKILKERFPFSQNSTKVEILNISSWAHKENSADNDSIYINMYSTTSSALKYNSSNSHNLEGVWSYQTTLVKNKITSDYLVDYIIHGTAIGEISGFMMNLVSKLGNIVSDLLTPKLPSPQAIATIFLGPLAAPAQQVISTISQQVSQYKPQIDLTVSIVKPILDFTTSLAKEKNSQKQLQIIEKFFTQYGSFIFKFLVDNMKPDDPIVKNIKEYKG